MRSDHLAVSVIGLGSMGSALASVLLEQGYETTVWNRSAHKVQSLVDRGARLAATPAEAVAASPLIIACVLDYEALHTVLDPVARLLAGKVLVNLTSGSPEQAGQTIAWARSHSADYLDGAIMTTPPGVGSPEMMFLYSGSAAAFEAHRPTLAALGDPLYLGADPGLASLYDAALLGLMWSTMTGWLHGTALVGADQTPATAFTPVAIRWLTTVAGFLTTYAPGGRRPLPRRRRHRRRTDRRDRPSPPRRHLPRHRQRPAPPPQVRHGTGQGRRARLRQLCERDRGPEEPRSRPMIVTPAVRRHLARRLDDRRCHGVLDGPCRSTRGARCQPPWPHCLFADCSLEQYGDH
jgi:hypothetical protein